MIKSEKDKKSFLLEILIKSNKSISSYLKLSIEKYNEVLKNIDSKENISGHNNKIFLVDFFNNEKAYLGSICIKLSLDKKRQLNLLTEANILKLLSRKKSICPKILDNNVLEQHGIAYLIIENIKGDSLNQLNLGIGAIQNVLESILFCESILLKNIKLVGLSTLSKDLHKKNNFQKKIFDLLTNYTSGFVVNDSLSFLNYYLNSKRVIKKRTVVTDRSIGNMIINQNNITFIDFSTIRIGSQFDNWIQFIDDPRAYFSCTKDYLIQIFFEKNNLRVKDIKYFYAASVYTNLLQGIFTYKKNPQLGMGYFNNANNSYMKLKNKKGALIDISHQHALR